MPRRKPTSLKDKKASLQLKRAIKRGDVPAPDPQKPAPRQKKRPGQHNYNQPRSAQTDSARRLQSKFTKLPPNFLDESKLVASSLPLPRPLSAQSAKLPSLSVEVPGTLGSLTCPRRPKWRYDMTKMEVERNEEGLFKKWVTEADTDVLKWQQSSSKAASLDIPDKPGTAIPESLTTMPRSTTYFERNLEVWRQLWRVTEISQIILVLLDSRCPLWHYPPSLAAYLSSAGKKHILVLTKTDISGPVRTEAWIAYLSKVYPNLPIVPVEAYAEKEVTAVHQGRKFFEPSIPQTFRCRLVDAIRCVHEQLLEPPDKVKSNPSLLEKWKPKIRTNIDWDSVLNAHGDKVGSAVGGVMAPRPHHEEGSEEWEAQEPQYLTIGLIGTPLV
jgi:hypothetical protein